MRLAKRQSRRRGAGTLLAAACIAGAASAMAAAPAFDCRKASGKAEQLICNDEALAALDRKMADVYARSMKNLPAQEQKTQRAMQRGWVKGRNDCWKSDDVRTCVESNYRIRLTELQIIGGLVEVPSYVGYVCNGDTSKRFTATFYDNTELPSAVLTYDDEQVIAQRAPSESGARYLGRNVDFREHRGEAVVEWVGAKLRCRPIGPRDGAAAPIIWNELKNIAYQGIEDSRQPIALKDGKWQGKPEVPGSASIARASLIEEISAHGDLDGDGAGEAAVLINYSSGGTGQFLHLAVVARRGAEVHNVATQLVGDRVQVRDLRIEDRQIVLEVVRAGPNDPSCCPGEVARLRWALQGGALKPVAHEEKPIRLSPEVLGGTQWVLRRWKRDEPAPATPEVTLAFRDGRFAGKAACNSYSASVKASGDVPGDIAVGPAMATRMACNEEAMALETRFLRQLGGVSGFRFDAGMLALAYGTGPEGGVMVFQRR